MSYAKTVYDHLLVLVPVPVAWGAHHNDNHGARCYSVALEPTYTWWKGYNLPC